MNIFFKILMISILSVPTSLLFADDIPTEFKIKNISLFRNEVQLELVKQNQLQVGSRLLAKSATSHKCLLIITKIQSRTAYADASQCPGFATLKKGQTVQIAGQEEVNEEVRMIFRKYSKLF